MRALWKYALESWLHLGKSMIYADLRNASLNEKAIKAPSVQQIIVLRPPSFTSFTVIFFSRGLEKSLRSLQLQQAFPKLPRGKLHLHEQPTPQSTLPRNSIRLS